MDRNNITRRTALKIMGSAALATMMATTGASALTSCIDSRKKNFRVVYVEHELHEWHECVRMAFVKNSGDSGNSCSTCLENWACRAIGNPNDFCLTSDYFEAPK